MRQSKLRLYWGQDYEPIERYTSHVTFRRCTRGWLMPGGNAILLPSTEGIVALYPTSPSGTRPSVQQLPSVSYLPQRPIKVVELTWTQLLHAT